MASQITTFIANKPGTLAGLCTAMKEAGLDMRAMNVSDAMDFGIVRIIVRDPKKAVSFLGERGYVCQTEDVLAIEVEDRPGALVDLLTALGEADVNVDYTYALFSRTSGTVGFVIKTSDREHAEKALEVAGIRLIPDEEL